MSSGGWRVVRGLLALVALATGIGVAGVGRAELQRVEAVGTYGIRESLRTRVIPRDEAIGNALWEGVSRVALEVIGESATASVAEEPLAGSEDTEEAPVVDLDSLRGALGQDVLPYTRSFRIVEDQGEQPVLFEDQPEIRTEYVVVVEVIVDVDRVTAALEKAGWIASRANGPAREVRLELIGLERYEALETVLAALRDRLGASHVRSLEFSPGRQVVAVEGPFGSEEIEGWLARFEDPQLALEPVGVDEAGRWLRIRARWTPLVEEGERPRAGP